MSTEEAALTGHSHDEADGAPTQKASVQGVSRVTSAQEAAQEVSRVTSAQEAAQEIPQETSAQGSSAQAVGQPVIDPEGEAGNLVFGDALFRKKRRHGWRLTEMPTPALELPIADSHTHLDMLSDPTLVLARCAVARIGFICEVTDPLDGAARAYDAIDEWRAQALVRLPEVFTATRANVERAQAGQGADGVDGLELTTESALMQRCPCDVAIPRVRMACGIHPHNASGWSEDTRAELLEHLADPRTAVLGEVGLDYWYDLSPRDVQRDVFRRQVELAHVTGLPLMLHLRNAAPEAPVEAEAAPAASGSTGIGPEVAPAAHDGAGQPAEEPTAHDDALAILDEEGWPEGGVILHCCSIGPDELRPWLERGTYIAFGGALTFKSSDAIRDSAAIVPADRLLLETDAPYMAPVPYRGQENGPEYTVFTAAYLADLRGCAPGEQRRSLLKQIWDTTAALEDRPATAWQQEHRS
jgi:TatD DNase family protein